MSSANGPGDDVLAADFTIDEATAVALSGLAQDAVSDPSVRSAIESALRHQITGWGSMTAPVVREAIGKALSDVVHELIKSSGLRSSLDATVRRQLEGFEGVGGLGRLGGTFVPPELRAAVGNALEEVVKDAIHAPVMRLALDSAIQQQLRGIGSGFTAPAVGEAVSKALDDVVKKAMLEPGTQSILDAAVRQQLHGYGIGLSSPAVSRAVSNALDDVVKDAVLTPSAQASIARAVRHQTARLRTSDEDPALAVMLRTQGTTSHDPGAVPLPEAKAAPAQLVTEGEFSERFTGADSFFAAQEVILDSFESLTTEIARLGSRNPGLRLVWRGHQDARWGLHSNLYRRLMEVRGIRLPGEKGPRDSQDFPDEEAMLEAEDTILAEAAEWRMSDRSGLELFARLQHQGGPTRLLDVTRNPLVAAWFAVEAGRADDCDARLFALATSASDSGASGAADPVLKEVLAGSRFPFWFFSSADDRRQADWGTGARRRIWVPPAYDARIASQNAAFLLEGVPMFTRETLRLFKDADGRQWNIVDIAASMSIYARPTHPHKRVRPNKANLAPLFTFRIKAEAKNEIRSLLESGYGLTTAIVYPDVQGLSTRLRIDSEWLRR